MPDVDFDTLFSSSVPDMDVDFDSIFAGSPQPSPQRTQREAQQLEKRGRVKEIVEQVERSLEAGDEEPVLLVSPRRTRHRDVSHSPQKTNRRTGLESFSPSSMRNVRRSLGDKQSSLRNMDRQSRRSLLEKQSSERSNRRWSSGDNDTSTAPPPRRSLGNKQTSLRDFSDSKPRLSSRKLRGEDMHSSMSSLQVDSSLLSPRRTKDSEQPPLSPRSRNRKTSASPKAAARPRPSLGSKQLSLKDISTPSSRRRRMRGEDMHSSMTSLRSDSVLLSPETKEESPKARTRRVSQTPRGTSTRRTLGKKQLSLRDVSDAKPTKSRRRPRGEDMHSSMTSLRNDSTHSTSSKREDTERSTLSPRSRASLRAAFARQTSDRSLGSRNKRSGATPRRQRNMSLVVNGKSLSNLKQALSSMDSSEHSARAKKQVAAEGDDEVSDKLTEKMNAKDFDKFMKDLKERRTARKSKTKPAKKKSQGESSTSSTEASSDSETSAAADGLSTPEQGKNRKRTKRTTKRRKEVRPDRHMSDTILVQDEKERRKPKRAQRTLSDVHDDKSPLPIASSTSLRSILLSPTIRATGDVAKCPDSAFQRKQRMGKKEMKKMQSVKDVRKESVRNSILSHLDEFE